MANALENLFKNGMHGAKMGVKEPDTDVNEAETPGNGAKTDPNMAENVGNEDKTDGNEAETDGNEAEIAEDDEIADEITKILSKGFTKQQRIMLSDVFVFGKYIGVSQSKANETLVNDA